jgi:hypothetical protein
MLDTVETFVTELHLEATAMPFRLAQMQQAIIRLLSYLENVQRARWMMQ